MDHKQLSLQCLFPQYFGPHSSTVIHLDHFADHKRSECHIHTKFQKNLLRLWSELDHSHLSKYRFLDHKRRRFIERRRLWSSLDHRSDCCHSIAVTTLWHQQQHQSDSKYFQVLATDCQIMITICMLFRSYHISG